MTLNRTAQLKAGVMLTYLSEFTGVLSGLIYTPIMLRLIGQSEYGIYQLSGSVTAYLSLLGMGLQSSYGRFYARCRVKNDTRGIAELNGMFISVFVCIGLVCLLAGGILTANAGVIFGASLSADEMRTSKILMAFMIFNMAISFPSGVFGSYVTMNERYVFRRTLDVMKNVLNPFITLPFLLMGYKSVAVTAVQTALSVAAFAANAGYAVRKLDMRFAFKKFDFKLFGDIFVFSFWIFLNQIIDQINWNVDKVILGVFGGTITVAVYGVASALNTIYIRFSTAVSGVFIPRVNKLAAEENNDAALTELFTKVGRIQFLILALVASGIIAFGGYFIQIWAGDGYSEAYVITLLLILPATVSLIQNLGIEIQRAKNMHRFRSMVYAVIAVLNIAVSIPLARRFGGTGAAAGTAASFIIGNGIIMNIFYHKKIGLDMVYFWKRILSFAPALIAPAAACFAIMKFVHFGSVPAFAAAVAAYTALYCASMWFFGMNNFERDLIARCVKAVKKRALSC